VPEWEEVLPSNAPRGSKSTKGVCYRDYSTSQYQEIKSTKERT
jgi:hypothetical protein